MALIVTCPMHGPKPTLQSDWARYGVGTYLLSSETNIFRAIHYEPDSAIPSGPESSVGAMSISYKITLYSFPVYSMPFQYSPSPLMQWGEYRGVRICNWEIVNLQVAEMISRTA